MTINSSGRGIAAIAAAVALALPAAGCGGGSDAGGVAHLDSTTTTTTNPPASGDPMAEAIKFANCMRNHGVPDFPDPRTSGTGNTMLSVPDSPKAKAAQAICRRFLSGGGKVSASEEAHRLASLLKYARCMREHRVNDFPDPDNQGQFPSTGGFSPSSPNFRTAEKACLPVAGGFVKTRG